MYVRGVPATSIVKLPLPADAFPQPDVGTEGASDVVPGPESDGGGSPASGRPTLLSIGGATTSGLGGVASGVGFDESGRGDAASGGGADTSGLGGAASTGGDDASGELLPPSIGLPGGCVLPPAPPVPPVPASPPPPPGPPPVDPARVEGGSVELQPVIANALTSAVRPKQWLQRRSMVPWIRFTIGLLIILDRQQSTTQGRRQLFSIFRGRFRCSQCACRALDLAMTADTSATIRAVSCVENDALVESFLCAPRVEELASAIPRSRRRRTQGNRI